MTITYRPIQTLGNEVKFADPDAFYNTVFHKVSTQPKKAGSQTVYNANSVINMQRTVIVPTPSGVVDACSSDSEKLSLRFSFSGSTASKIEARRMIADFRIALDLFEADMVSGFVDKDVNLVLTGNDWVVPVV